MAHRACVGVSVGRGQVSAEKNSDSISIRVAVAP